MLGITCARDKRYSHDCDSSELLGDKLRFVWHTVRHPTTLLDGSRSRFCVVIGAASTVPQFGYHNRQIAALCCGWYSPQG